jgi:hypothetical protein
MQHAIKRSDGTVAVMMMVPIAIEYEIEPGHRITTAVTEVRDQYLETGAGLLEMPCPVHELKPDSIAGFTLIFLSPEDEIKKWHPTAQSAVVSIHPLANGDVPTDRTFRDAWTHNGTTIVHDIGKAREIHRNNIRAARAPLFATLDIEYQRADETGDKAAKAAIVAKKAQLRDATRDPKIDAAATVDALKLAWPAVLS